MPFWIVYPRSKRCCAAIEKPSLSLVLARLRRVWPPLLRAEEQYPWARLFFDHDRGFLIITHRTTSSRDLHLGLPVTSPTAIDSAPASQSERKGWDGFCARGTNGARFAYTYAALSTSASPVRVLRFQARRMVTNSNTLARARLHSTSVRSRPTRAAREARAAWSNRVAFSSRHGRQIWNVARIRSTLMPMDASTGRPPATAPETSKTLDSAR